MSHERFFLDHGAIHDRVTGQHVGMQAEIEWQSRLLNLLNTMQDRIQYLEKSLHRISDTAKAATNDEGYLKLLFNHDWLRNTVPSDLDDEPMAGDGT